MSMLVRKISELLTLEDAFQKQSRNIVEADLGVQKKWAIFIESGKVAWIGPDSQIPRSLVKKKQIKEISGLGKTVLPGIVECHTHTVFAGHRADEFEMLRRGRSYSEIAAQGGGIVSTMKKTRAASRSQLLEKSQMHVDEFVRQGVTTLEVKSGYALNLKDEIKQLQVAAALVGPRIVSTFLGAHAKPPEFASYEEYLVELQEKILPIIKRKKLAERIDIFIDQGFFPIEASRKYLEYALKLGFQITIHSDQLSLSGGAELAVELGARSADHLIRISEPQIQKLAKSEVSCVLLPTADLYLKCPYPPARKLIEAGARVALATDFNPGSSPTQDLALVGLLARLEMNMTLPEVISAYTVGASFALGLQSEVGSLSLGKCADFLSTDRSWNELFYSAGNMGIGEVYQKGRKLNIAQ